MNYIRQRLLDIEQQTWISEIHNDERKDPHQKNKLRTFRKFKLTHDYENYLTNVRNINHRVAITKLRLSNHKLAIVKCMGYFDSPCKMYHLILTPKKRHRIWHLCQYHSCNILPFDLEGILNF